MLGNYILFFTIPPRAKKSDTGMKYVKTIIRVFDIVIEKLYRNVDSQPSKTK